MEELGIPELNSDQIEELCSLAEDSARGYVLSKIPPKTIETLNICAEVSGTRPVTLTIDVEIVVPPPTRDREVRKIADEAVKAAFRAAESYLGELKCLSQK